MHMTLHTCAPRANESADACWLPSPQVLGFPLPERTLSLPQSFNASGGQSLTQRSLSKSRHKESPPPKKFFIPWQGCQNHRRSVPRRPRPERGDSLTH